MPKVMSHTFCSKFHALSSSAEISKIGMIWKSYREFKGGNFFETQYVVMYCNHDDVDDDDDEKKEERQKKGIKIS